MANKECQKCKVPIKWDEQAVTPAGKTTPDGKPRVYGWWIEVNSLHTHTDERCSHFQETQEFMPKIPQQEIDEVPEIDSEYLADFEEYERIRTNAVNFYKKKGRHVADVQIGQMVKYTLDKKLKGMTG